MNSLFSVTACVRVNYRRKGCKRERSSLNHPRWSALYHKQDGFLTQTFATPTNDRCV
jgi:hypothetical protein